MKTILGPGGIYFATNDFFRDKETEKMFNDNPFNVKYVGESLFNGRDSGRQMFSKGGVVGRHKSNRECHKDSHDDDDDDYDGVGTFKSFAMELDDDDDLRRPYKNGGSIQIEISHPGALHRRMGIPKNERIPVEALDKEMRKAKRNDDVHLERQVQFAKNARKFKHKV